MDVSLKAMRMWHYSHMMQYRKAKERTCGQQIAGDYSLKESFHAGCLATLNGLLPDTTVQQDIAESSSKYREEHTRRH